MRRYKRLYQEEAMKNKQLKLELNIEKELHQRTLRELNKLRKNYLKLSANVDTK